VFEEGTVFYKRGLFLIAIQLLNRKIIGCNSKSEISEDKLKQKFEILNDLIKY
jgi:hypothetical protein